MFKRKLLLTCLIALTATLAACSPLRYRANPAPGFHLLPIEGNARVESVDFIFDVQDWVTQGSRSYGDNRVTATYQLFSDSQENITVALPWAALVNTSLQEVSVTLDGQEIDWKLLALPDFYVDTRVDLQGRGRNQLPPPQDPYIQGGEDMLLTFSPDGKVTPANLNHVLASLESAVPIEEVDYFWEYQDPWVKVSLPDGEQVQGPETRYWMQHMLMVFQFDLNLGPGNNELVVRYPLAAGRDNTNTILHSYEYFMYMEPDLWDAERISVTINLPKGYRLIDSPTGFSSSGATYTANYTSPAGEDLAFTLHRTFPASVLNRTMFQLYAVPHLLIGFFLLPILIITIWAGLRGLRRFFGANG